MQPNFTIQDIKDFIKEEFSLNWYGYIYDFDKHLFVEAKLSDFEILSHHNFQVFGPQTNKNEEYNEDDDVNSEYDDIITIVICPEGTFRVTSWGDFSEKWKSFIANKKENILSV